MYLSMRQQERKDVIYWSQIGQLLLLRQAEKVYPGYHLRRNISARAINSLYLSLLIRQLIALT